MLDDDVQRLTGSGSPSGGPVTNSDLDTVVRSMTEDLAPFISLHDQGLFLFGSWTRGTLCREQPAAAIDIALVLNYFDHRAGLSQAGALLERLRSALDQCEYKPILSTTEELTVDWHETRLRLFPAFRRSDGSYVVTRGDGSDWVNTDPHEYAAFVSSLDQRLQGTFRPLVRAVKLWHRQTNMPFTGFHLETMALNHFDSYARRYSFASMLTAFFCELPAYISTPCNDPTTGERVDGYCQPLEVIDEAHQAATLARKAYSLRKVRPQLSLEHWAKLLGRPRVPDARLSP